MDTRPIGVYDSGVGGLTGLRALMRLLPPGNYKPDDTAHLPPAEPVEPQPPVHGRDDVVLTEALNILADLVKLTGGNEAPDTPDASTSAFWSILGGEQ